MMTAEFQNDTGAAMIDSYYKFEYKSASCALAVDEDGHWIVERVYSKERNKGHADGLLQLITDWADEHDLELYLRAQAYGHPVQTILNNQQLVAFYQKHGFVRKEGAVPGSKILMMRPRGKNRD